MRLVVSARDRDRAGTIMPGGQSGDRWSTHYDDQLADFLAGRLKRTPVSRERLQVVVRERWLPPPGQVR
jgi:acyl-homoserine lactone acylase PvdQ